MLEKAKWIAAGEPDCPSPLLRSEFQVKPGVSGAVLQVCALGYGEVTINGELVTGDVLTTPFTRFDKTVLCQQYAVEDLLKPGKNMLGVMLGNGWYNEIAATWDYEKAPWRHHPKLISQLTISYMDGSEEIVGSDSSWTWAPGPCIYNHVRCGEVWDARLERPGWDCPEASAEGWAPARLCRSPGGEMKTTEMPSIRITNTLPAREIQPGLYDVEENISGWARIKVSGQAGDTVDLYYGERVTPEGALDTEDSNRFCTEEFAHHDRYILKGGKEEEWEPHFCYHGFRYIRVETQASLLSLEGRVVHTDLEVVGDFSCSDEMLNRIHRAARRSTLYNYHSIPTDCPHREQNGWTGDALLSSDQAITNFDMTEAYRKWMGDFRDVQRPSGQLPGVIPTGGWGFNWGSGPAWDSALILIPYALWKYTGDLSVAEEFWPNMERYMTFLESMTENGLVDFGLGDWCPPRDVNLCPTMLTDTAYSYRDAMAMREMAAALKAPGQRYEEQAERAREAFRKKYVVDGRVAPESQTAYACAIYQGLLTEEEEIRAAARLNELVVEKDYHIDCGILGTKYIFRALSDYGYASTLYRMVTNPTCPSYAYWINQGMTTLCEDWEMTISLNHHMFSEVELWFYRYLAGIRGDEENLVIEPIFLPELSWVKAESRGVHVHWTREWIEVETPRNALLRFDGREQRLSPGRTRLSRKG